MVIIFKINSNTEEKLNASQNAVRILAPITRIAQALSEPLTSLSKVVYVTAHLRLVKAGAGCGFLFPVQQIKCVWRRRRPAWNLSLRLFCCSVAPHSRRATLKWRFETISAETLKLHTTLDFLCSPAVFSGAPKRGGGRISEQPRHCEGLMAVACSAPQKPTLTHLRSQARVGQTESPPQIYKLAATPKFFSFYCLRSGLYNCDLIGLVCRFCNS